MIIGDRIRLLRETKKLSQGDIEKRTGLLRCYISRVENGHTVPAIETLEKLARPWKSRSTSFSTTAKNHPCCRTFPSGSRRTISRGEAVGKMLGPWDVSVACSVVLMKATVAC